MNYTTSLDRLSKIITIATSILFIVIIVGQFALLPKDHRLISIVTALFLTGCYALIFSLRPVSYVLTTDSLIIHRLLKDVLIKRSTIIAATALDKNELRNSIRTFGVGGLFGYFGRFANPKLGYMTWYATRRDNAILINTTGKKKIILTPDDPIAFLAAINR